MKIWSSRRNVAFALECDYSSAKEFLKQESSLGYYIGVAWSDGENIFFLRQKKDIYPLTTERVSALEALLSVLGRRNRCQGTVDFASGTLKESGINPDTFNGMTFILNCIDSHIQRVSNLVKYEISFK